MIEAEAEKPVPSVYARVSFKNGAGLRFKQLRPPERCRCYSMDSDSGEDSPPPPSISPPASEADAREVRISQDSFAPPPPAREDLRHSQDSFAPPPPAREAALRLSQDSYARQSQDSYLPPPPRQSQDSAPPPPWEDDNDDDDDDDDAPPRAWHDADAAVYVPDGLDDAARTARHIRRAAEAKYDADFEVLGSYDAPRGDGPVDDTHGDAAWDDAEDEAAAEARAFAALAADGPPPWADDRDETTLRSEPPWTDDRDETTYGADETTLRDETTLWQAAASTAPAWAEDDEDDEEALDLDDAPPRRSSEQLERFSRLRKSRSHPKPVVDDEGPPPQSALVAKLFGRRPVAKKAEAAPVPVPLSAADRGALERELKEHEAELAAARAACRKLRSDVDAAQRRATTALAERTAVRSQRQAELEEWIAQERGTCKRESLALHRDRRSRRDERVTQDREKKKEVERLKDEANALRDQLDARARRDRLTERRMSDRNAQAEAKARELATQLTLLEAQNAQAAANRAQRAAARAADQDAFGLRVAEVATARALAEETMSLNETSLAPSETFLDQPTQTFFEAETRLEASYDAGRYAAPPVDEDDASDSGVVERAPPASEDSFAAPPPPFLRPSQDGFAPSARQSADRYAPPPSPARPSVPPPPPQEPAWRPAGRDGKLEREWADGARDVKYKNGTTKRCSAAGEVVVSFANGDTKTTSCDGVVVYFYATAGTTHTTDPDRGIETFTFPNGQNERHFASGAKEIRFADGTVKLLRADGGTETTFADGQVVVEEPPE